MILNIIQKKLFLKWNLKLYWLNVIEKLKMNFVKSNFKFDRNFYLIIVLNVFEIAIMLISNFSFVNKSLMISIFSFQTAKHNAVL